MIGISIGLWQTMRPGEGGVVPPVTDWVFTPSGDGFIITPPPLGTGSWVVDVTDDGALVTNHPEIV